MRLPVFFITIISILFSPALAAQPSALDQAEKLNPFIGFTEKMLEEASKLDGLLQFVMLILLAASVISWTFIFFKRKVYIFKKEGRSVS